MRRPVPYRITRVLDSSVVVAMNGASFGIVLEIATTVVRNAARFTCIRLYPLVGYERRSIKHGSQALKV